MPRTVSEMYLIIHTNLVVYVVFIDHHFNALSFLLHLPSQLVSVGYSQRSLGTRTRSTITFYKFINDLIHEHYIIIIIIILVKIQWWSVHVVDDTGSRRPFDVRP